MSQRFVRLNGCDLLLREEGPEAAPAVLLLHSLFFDGTMFDALCAHLKGQFRFIRPDHRGQGGSLPTTLPPSMEQLAQDMVLLLKRLGISVVHVVGSSMGAYVAMQMMQQEPHLITSVSLLCCTAKAEQEPERFLGLVEKLRHQTPEQMVDIIANTMFGNAFLADPQRADQRQAYKARFAALPTTVADAAYQVFTRKGNEAALAAYDKPVLLVGGALDRAKHPSNMQEIKDLLPGSRLVILPDSGHTPAVETPAQLADILLTWWAETPKADLKPSLQKVH